MIVLPAVNVFKGRVVKLDPSTHTTKTRDYGAPEDVARMWIEEGARHLYVVDLDAAVGTDRTNRDHAIAIGRIALPKGAQVYFGGGIREARSIGEWLNGFGMTRVVVGTRAITDAMWLSLVLKLFRERLVMAIDEVDGQVVVRGWQETDGVSTVEFVRRANDWPVNAFLYTNVRAEGADAGVDWRPVEALLKVTSKPVIFSGGITGLDEIRRFRSMGAAGVVLGSCLYSGSVKLAEAIAAAGGE